MLIFLKTITQFHTKQLIILYHFAVGLLLPKQCLYCYAFYYILARRIAEGQFQSKVRTDLIDFHLFSEVMA